MTYDYGIKHISKYTGLSGLESKNIIKAFEKKGLAYDVVDWKALGGDARDFGKRTDAVWDKLGRMYGISRPYTKKGLNLEIQRYDEMQEKQPIYLGDLQFEICMKKHMGRSRISQRIDDRLKAKKVFSLKNLKGIKKWMKHPELYDVMGIDYHKGYSKKR